MNNTINNMFINAIGSKSNESIIIAMFANGREATYTTAILPLLRTDPAVITVYDANTGEILYDRNN